MTDMNIHDEDLFKVYNNYYILFYFIIHIEEELLNKFQKILNIVVNIQVMMKLKEKITM